MKAVSADGLVRCEVKIALNGQAKRPACAFQFTDPHGAKLRAADAEITEPEGDVGIIRKDFRQKPGCRAIRREELYDRVEVDVVASGLPAARRSPARWK